MTDSSNSLYVNFSSLSFPVGFSYSPYPCTFPIFSYLYISSPFTQCSFSIFHFTLPFFVLYTANLTLHFSELISLPPAITFPPIPSYTILFPIHLTSHQSLSFVSVLSSHIIQSSLLLPNLPLSRFPSILLPSSQHRHLLVFPVICLNY